MHNCAHCADAALRNHLDRPKASNTCYTDGYKTGLEDAALLIEAKLAHKTEGKTLANGIRKLISNIRG